MKKINFLIIFYATLLIFTIYLVNVAAEANNSTVNSGTVSVNVLEPPKEAQNDFEPLASPQQPEANNPNNLEGNSQDSLTKEELFTPFRILPIAFIAALVIASFLVEKKRKSFAKN